MNIKKPGLFCYLITLFILASCNNSKDADITAVSINGVAGTINDVSITVALPTGTPVTSLTPSITISENATVSPGSGVARDFSAPVIYTVTAENESVTKKYVVMVTTGSSPTPDNLCSSSTHPTTTFESGSGTKTDPYVICTATQLNLIGDVAHRDRLTKAYKLGANIDMTGLTLVPLSDVDNEFAFNGTFDGNNKSISNITINEPNNGKVAFIPILGAGGEVKNLGLENVDITGDYMVGGLVGWSMKAVISNCYVTGTVKGNTFYIGGLVGYTELSNIISSYTTGTVTGLTADADRTGGLVGHHSISSYITNSYSTSSVSGDSNVGGLIGQSEGIVMNSMATGTVTYTDEADNKAYIGGLIGYISSESSVDRSYATGAVTGGSFTGGLVGQSSDANISSSYATGSVSGLGNTGGLCGGTSSNIYNSYSTGSVEGRNNVGGLVGYNDQGNINMSYSFGAVTGTHDPDTVGGLVGTNNSGNCEYSFWNTDITITSACGVGKTTAEMHNGATYTDEYWDFDHDWSMDTSDCSSYPASPSPYLYPCLRKLFFVCFTGDTLITMADGKTKRIDRVKKGEKVMSFDDTNKITVSTIGETTIRTISKYLTITTNDNTMVKVTPEHPFYYASPAKFKPIKMFKVGDTLYVEKAGSLTPVKITSIKVATDKIKVYNMHNVNGPHTYFANGFAVHNK